MDSPHGWRSPPNVRRSPAWKRLGKTLELREIRTREEHQREVMMMGEGVVPLPMCSTRGFYTHIG